MTGHGFAVDRRINLRAHAPYMKCPRGVGPGGAATVGPRGELVHGCSVCWSTRYWRLVCTTCTWQGQWVDGAVPAEQAAAFKAYTDHAPGINGVLRKLVTHGR